jgi:hypothetical protein
MVAALARDRPVADGEYDARAPRERNDLELSSPRAPG